MTAKMRLITTTKAQSELHDRGAPVTSRGSNAGAPIALVVAAAAEL